MATELIHLTSAGGKLAIVRDKIVAIRPRAGDAIEPNANSGVYVVGDDSGFRVNETYEEVCALVEGGDPDPANSIAVFTLEKIKIALAECHDSFRRREHGGVAEQVLRHRLELLLQMPYNPTGDPTDV